MNGRMPFFSQNEKMMLIQDFVGIYYKFRQIIIKKMEQHNEQDEDFKNMELFQSFIAAIQQQKLNPNILLFQKEKFDSISKQIKEQRENLSSFMKEDYQNEISLSQKNLRHKIYMSQIQKIDYLLKMYLRIRLKKIQLYCFHLMKNEQEAQKLLSDKQMVFLKKYAQLRYQYYKDNIFKHLIKNYRDFKGLQVIFAKNQQQVRERKLFIESKQSQIELRAPNLNQYVFAEIQSNPKQLMLGRDVAVSNYNSEQVEVISQRSIIFGPIKNISQNFSTNQYKLI